MFVFCAKMFLAALLPSVSFMFIVTGAVRHLVKVLAHVIFEAHDNDMYSNCLLSNRTKHDTQAIDTK